MLKTLQFYNYILESQINETLFNYCLKFDITSNEKSLPTN